RCPDAQALPSSRAVRRTGAASPAAGSLRRGRGTRRRSAARRHQRPAPACAPPPSAESRPARRTTPAGPGRCPRADRSELRAGRPEVSLPRCPRVNALVRNASTVSLAVQRLLRRDLLDGRGRVAGRRGRATDNAPLATSTAAVTAAVAGSACLLTDARVVYPS